MNLWHRLVAWLEPVYIEPIEDEDDEDIDLAPVSSALDAARAAAEAGLPGAVAEALGQFCDELYQFDSVSSADARRYGRDFLEHLLNLTAPLPQ